MSNSTNNFQAKMNAISQLRGNNIAEVIQEIEDKIWQFIEKNINFLMGKDYILSLMAYDTGYALALKEDSTYHIVERWSLTDNNRGILMQEAIGKGVIAKFDGVSFSAKFRL